jgi:hypothetical protein
LGKIKYSYIYNVGDIINNSLFIQKQLRIKKYNSLYKAYEIICLVCKNIEIKDEVTLKNKYETLNQHFFLNAMCLPIPNFVEKYEDIEVNTVDNQIAYIYKLIETKKLKEESKTSLTNELEKFSSEDIQSVTNLDEYGDTKIEDLITESENE